jgi:hypothetical protein
MKINLTPKSQAGGFVLLLVLVMAACTLIILGGVLYRTSTVSGLNMRSTQYLKLNNAAEAATEKVYDRMAADFAYGPGYVSNYYAAGTYSAIVPASTDNSYFTNITFSDAAGNINQTHVAFLTNYVGNLPSQYTNGYATTSPIYRIISNTRMSNSAASSVIGTAQEDIMLALVPITTYAIFYNGNLEFSDCATMIVNGRVHSNANICVGAGSGSTLTFNGPVTSVGSMSAPERGGVNDWTVNDPTTWATTFNAGYSITNPAISLSMNMTNTHSIIDLPPAGESPLSLTGQQRLYNEAEIVIVVTNGPTGSTNPTVMVTLQTPYNGEEAGNDPSKEATTLTNATQVYLNTNALLAVPFLSLTNTFADQRQNQSSQYVTQIDVAQLSNWMNTNAAVGNGTGSTGKFSNGNYPEILYVADQRGATGTKQAVVRVVHASQLPYNAGYGFSVATENPIYIEGNYNTQVSNTVTHAITQALTLGSTTNGGSIPSAILADAVTILSAQWTDAESGLAYGSRANVTSSQTLNAALVTGAMPSTDVTATTFSGGVQNLTRFLENWSGVTLTLNTSIVNLFNSKIATAQFQMPGIYYNPPTRAWGFDTTYYSPDKQPPGAPCALVPIRFNWQKPPPNSISTSLSAY